MDSTTKKFMDLKEGDTLYCVSSSGCGVYKATVEKINRWDMIAHLKSDWLVSYMNPQCPITHSDISFLTNYGDVICTSKKTALKVIKNKIHDLKKCCLEMKKI